jgi:hypothetical protein
VRQLPAVLQLPAAARGLDCGSCLPRPGGWTAAAAGRGPGTGLLRLQAAARGLDCGSCRPRPGGGPGAGLRRLPAAARGLAAARARGWTAVSAGRVPGAGLRRLPAVARGAGLRRLPAAARGLDCGGCRPEAGLRLRRRLQALGGRGPLACRPTGDGLRLLPAAARGLDCGFCRGGRWPGPRDSYRPRRRCTKWSSRAVKIKSMLLCQWSIYR